MNADWADALDYATQSIALAGLPEHQRLAALGTLALPTRGKLNCFANGCASRTPRALKDSLCEQAYFRCTLAALAAERFRLLTGEWPKSLEVIPKAILPSVPLDPMTGKPILYVRRADGVTVYSVGMDGLDDGGKIDRSGPPIKHGPDLGIRLYNPNQRRLPSLQLPEVKPNLDDL
jgi:hypothetical protein